jgi:molecular chaperone GrpE
MAQKKDKKTSTVHEEQLTQEAEEANSEEKHEPNRDEKNKESMQEVETKEVTELNEQIAELEEKIKQLESENSDLKNQYLRKQADFENFRKRMFREKEDAIKYANSNLLLDLVTIIDDFERAIKAGEGSEDIESFRQGIELIEKQLTGTLERKWGLKRFDSEGEVFDPEKHEAIATEETNHEESIVLEDYLKGYYLHDRVLRHAKVKVSMPAKKENANNNMQQESEQEETEETNRGEE